MSLCTFALISRRPRTARVSTSRKTFEVENQNSIRSLLCLLFAFNRAPVKSKLRSFRSFSTACRQNPNSFEGQRISISVVSASVLMRKTFMIIFQYVRAHSEKTRLNFQKLPKTFQQGFGNFCKLFFYFDTLAVF